VTPVIERLQLRWKCNIYFTPAHLRVIGGWMLLIMQQNRAKMGQKQRQKQNEDMRGVIQFILFIFKYVNDIDSS